MNRFGRWAETVWRTLAPTAYDEIPDPRAHFSALGVEAESQWGTLWPQLAGRDSPAEDFHMKVGRIENAKLRAEEIIRADLLTPPPDVQECEPGEDEPDPLAEVCQAWRDLMNDET